MPILTDLYESMARQAQARALAQMPRERAFGGQCSGLLGQGAWDGLGGLGGLAAAQHRTYNLPHEAASLVKLRYSESARKMTIREELQQEVDGWIKDI